jgi:hypothetical protein
LPIAQFAYNNGKHASTGSTPFKLNYNRDPRVLYVERNLEDNVKANQQTNDWERSLTIAKEQLEKARNKMSKDQNPKRRQQPDWPPGTKVYLSKKNIPSKRPSKKLDVLKMGPFEIEEKVSEVTYRIRLPNTTRHPVFHVSLLDEAPESAELAKEAKELLEDEYEVEKILDQRKRGRRNEYLVKWKDYPDSDNSWEPSRNLAHCPEKLQEFRQESPRTRTQ